jgi:hypothetical protein
MAILAVAAAIVAIVLLSSGGNDDQSGTADTVATGPGASTQTTETSGTQSGSDGTSTTGTQGEQSSGERRARHQPRRSSSRREPHRQTQGRLGPQTGGSPAQGGTPARPTDRVKLGTINVSGGSAVGGVQRIRFEKGKRARLIVYSDSNEVVEIPDYGLKRRVGAGSSARFYFRPSKKGLFVILLERGQTRIGVLQVE